MASTKSYLDFIMEQLPAGASSRAMMGEYVLYYRGRVFGGIYDDRLLVKPTAGARELLPRAPLEEPYPGAKPMLLVEDPEDRDLLRNLILAMEPELPEKKQRKKAK